MTNADKCARLRTVAKPIKIPTPARKQTTGKRGRVYLKMVPQCLQNLHLQPLSSPLLQREKHSSLARLKMDAKPSR